MLTDDHILKIWESIKAGSPREYRLAVARAIESALAQAGGKPIAWRLRIGDSDMWSYCETESDADFYGNQSGLPFVKEPLYAAAAIAQQRGEG